MLSRSERSFVLARLYCGFMAIPSTALSVYTLSSGVRWPLPFQVVLWFGSVAWIGYYALGAWLNTHRPWRVLQALALFIPAALMEAPVLLYSLIWRPKTFEVIRKE